MAGHARFTFGCCGLCLAAAMSYGTVTESFYFKDNLTFYAYNLTQGAAQSRRRVQLCLRPGGERPVRPRSR